MSIINEALLFNGTWRTYQKRVLDRSMLYLRDKKVHIVAAPGSGKTTLGIELIKRAANPCLILSPSIVIRQQWLSRIEDAFLSPDTGSSSLLSADIRKPAPITAITYQALHSAMTRQKGAAGQSDAAEENADDEEDFSLDYSGFDILSAINKMKIGTVCLDECHHLKNEWWKALEDFMKTLPNVTVISLTATPPYDSTPAQWERYINLCGPIDEEIIVPELVREGSLCPHQDYVYFNYPTTDEEAAVLNFRTEAKETIDGLMSDETFAHMIASHAGLKDIASYEEKFLDYPAYLSSLLIFLNQKNISFSPELLRLLGTKNLPKMTANWMEILLQGFLYDDTDSYMTDKVYREGLIKTLKSQDFIVRNRVGFTANEALEKMLINSKGKINSISDIVQSEYTSLGKNLRLLILTDYIRKEYRRAIGNPNMDITSLGVLPFFEMLRRQKTEGLRLGILCGGIIVIPAEAVSRLNALASEYGGLEKKITCNELTDADGTALDYSEVNISGKKHISTSLITKLFEEGYIQVLIGTKSLLGEGWDSPCINTLILASFVGSFVLSNQMRGRAIRVMKGNPDKTSNIWHLICMTSENASREAGGSEQQSEDFLTLERRMKGFLGVSYTDSTIENGMERLSIIAPPYTHKNIERINEKMCLMANERTALKKKWESSLVLLDKIEVADECKISKEKLSSGAYFINLWGMEIISLLSCIFFLISYLMAVSTIGRFSIFSIIIFILMLTGFSFTLRYGQRILCLITPLRRMDSIGKAVLSALKQTGNIQSTDVKVKVEEAEDFVVFAYLKGGTAREKDMFAECLLQFFSPVENQRYLLYMPNSRNKLLRFFCVPDTLAGTKENAALFQAELRKYMGNYELIYTRNANGRKILLKARAEAFANRNTDCPERKKKVKSTLE